jgi:intracellular sulfur oxidation DsrE/DsrF family protein
MRFKLSYITRDFHFSNTEIRVLDPGKGIEVVYKKRPNDDGEKPPYEENDGLIVAVCERSLTERLHNEAVSSGVLSRNKEAVQKVFDEMQGAIQRAVRLARWKTNAIGGPNTIRMGTPNYFVWSEDGSNWKLVADSISHIIGFTLTQLDRHWSSADAEFLQVELVKGTDEPP